MSGDSDSSSAATPDLPSDLVGDQGDSRAGPNKSGNRHTSGALTPENGGTGDFESNLETLAGETRPAGLGDSAPLGSMIGENVFLVDLKIVVVELVLIYQLMAINHMNLTLRQRTKLTLEGIGLTNLQIQVVNGSIARLREFLIGSVLCGYEVPNKQSLGCT